MANNFYENYLIESSRGVLDAIIDIGRDLEHLDNTQGVQTIIDCVNDRIGTPDSLIIPPEYEPFRLNEPRLIGYMRMLRLLCYSDFGNGSIKALIDLSRQMRGYYGENAVAGSGMEALDDTISEMIGSPPPRDERYSVITGYVNMLRFVHHLAHLKGI